MKKLICAALAAFGAVFLCLPANAQGFHGTSPWNVDEGGTGKNSLTAHGLLLGNGTGPFNVIGPCNSGVPILGAGSSADPTCSDVTTSHVTNQLNATGSVVRNALAKLTETVSITDFTGADPTGVTASDTALSSAINYLISAGGGELFFPTGTYLLNSCYSANLASQINLAFVGNSSSVPKINLGTGGCLFSLTTSGGNAGISQITVSNLLGNPTGIVTNPFIKFNPAGAGTTQVPNLIAGNLYIGPQSGVTGAYFSGGCIDGTGTDRPYLSNVICTGPNGAGTNTTTENIAGYTVASPGVVQATGCCGTGGFKTGDTFTFEANGSTPPTGLTDGTSYAISVIDADHFHVATTAKNAYAGTFINFTGSPTTSPTPTAVFDDYRDNSARFATAFCFKFDNSYGPTLLRTQCIAAATAWSLHGTNQEGGIGRDNIATDVITGLDWLRTSNQPDLQWSGGQINFRDYGAKISGLKGGFVNSVDFREQPAAEYSTNAPADIYCDSCNNGVSFFSNWHELDSDPRRYAYWLGDASNTREAHVISPFIAGTYAAVINAGNANSDNITVTNPQILSGSTVTTKVVSSSTLSTCSAVSWWSIDENNLLSQNGRLESFCTDTTRGPNFDVVQTRKTPADGDTDGAFRLRATQTDGSEVSLLRIQSVADTVANTATAKSHADFIAQGGSGSEVTPLSLGGSGGSPTLAFFGGTRGTRPTVSGNRNGNAAIASLLSGVCGLGLCTDSTTSGGQVALANGGTNADLSATGGASQVLKQVSAGAAITVGQLAASDLSNGTTGSGSVVLNSGATLSIQGANVTLSDFPAGVRMVCSTAAGTLSQTCSSAGMRASISDETGTGVSVFNISPSLTTPKIAVGTVSGLPTCNSTIEGTRSGVTDATATTFASIVAGSGSNHVPVYCNGTNWIIGG